MAALSKTLMASHPMFYENVMAIPDSNYDIAFDSTLEMPTAPGQNYTLRLTLRIFYRQINPPQVTAVMMQAIAASLGVPVPSGATAGFYPDADNNQHLVKDWTLPEWTAFLNGVKTQAKLWDSRFWLIPPDNFPQFDVYDKVKSRKMRPNVKCEFKFEVAVLRSAAHSTIEVANIIGPGFFRSHSRLYNTSDAAVRPTAKLDLHNAWVNTKQPVIAHEIGHALGLPHIGISRNLSPCGFAVVWEQQQLAQATIPWMYRGGSNADVCYGRGSSAGDINNIMGAGSVFSQENAKPWLDRLPAHLNVSGVDAFSVSANLPRWKVAMSNTLPRFVS